MRRYEKVHSKERPKDIEMTSNAVYLAEDIVPYKETIDGHTLEGYEYTYIEYSKDEYMLHQDAKIAFLESELAAAKILLGVD